MSDGKQRIAPHPVLNDYYRQEDERRAAVDRMFDISAVHYDWITDVMSFGSGKWYRRDALVRAGIGPGMKVLDVGAGTGAVSLLAQELVTETGLVVALDPSRGMLAEAKQRGVKHTFMGLGERLPFADASFDVVSMGYALRHVADLVLLFEEYRRVLKPGGKILLLEITRPGGGIGLSLLRFYMKSVVPKITRMFRRSADAEKLMRYYWDTIDQCVSPNVILAAMEQAGLQQAKRHLVMGMFSEYTGFREG